jgi:hypothetical protein
VGVTFGFRYRVVGKGKGAAKLKTVIHFPSRGLRNPKTGEITTVEAHRGQAPVGEANYNSYTFDEDWEIVRGTWTFEVWEGDRKLASQSFNIVRAT